MKNLFIIFFCCFLRAMNNDNTVIGFNDQDRFDLLSKLERVKYKHEKLKEKLRKISKDPLFSDPRSNELFGEILSLKIQHELCYNVNILSKKECNTLLKKKCKKPLNISFPNLKSRILTLESNYESFYEKMILIEKECYKFLEDERKIPISKNRRAFLRRCIYRGAFFALGNVALCGLSVFLNNNECFSQFEPTSDASINSFIRGSMSFSPVLLGNYFMYRQFFFKGGKQKTNKNQEINNKKGGKGIGSFLVWCIYRGICFSAGNIRLYGLRDFLIDNKGFPQFDIAKDYSVLKNCLYFCVGNFLIYKLT